MINKKIILLAGFLLVGYVSAFAQKYNVKTYTVNDGLPSSYVYDVIIDEAGFVWFATANGLSKFDGKHYKNYDTDAGLKDALIYDIHKDKDGDFWISTEQGGIAKFKNDSLIYLPELASLDSVLINYIYDGPNGTLWFGSNDKGLYEWDKKSAPVQKITEDNGLTDNQIWDFVFDAEGKAWISTSSGVSVYEADGGISKTFTSENGLAGKLTYQVFLASDGNKWVPTSNGVSIIMPDNSVENITEIDGEKLGYVFSISEDKDGVIWIGTERSGLYWFDGSSFTHVTKRNGLSNNSVYRLIKDNQGTIWVATDGDGVSIFRDKNFLRYESSSKLDANTIYSALKTKDGTLWFGTENGISSYKKGAFKNYVLPEKFFDEDEIWDIEEMANGHLLMLTIDYDLIEFDGENFFHPTFYDALYEYYLSDIFVEEDGTIWFAAFQALLKYKNGKLEKFEPPQDTYWQTTLGSITKDSRGYLWLGTEAGVAKFDGEKFTYYSENEGLRGVSVYDIKEDNLGNIWVGTNKGISILQDFDEEGSPTKIIPFQTEKMFMQETIFLQFDQFGNLWQGTNGGLNYYDLGIWWGHNIVNQLHFPFNEFGNGIEFNGWASVLDNNGTLWFGSAENGLINYSFSNGKEKLEAVKPPVVFLREVLANNTPIYNQLSEADDSEVDLKTSYERNNLNFKFNAIDYKDPNRISYMYMLKGFDNDWQLGTDIEEVRYTNITPGNYEFLVRVKSIKSNWSKTFNLSKITIDKPYWKTVQFYLLSIAVFFGLVLSFIKLSFSRLEKKNLKVLVDEQTKDLQIALNEKEVLIKEIHHRVKNNLAVVSGLLELQSWNIPDGDAKKAIQESKMRVLAMSKIHENLYQNEDLARVNFKKFLEDLVQSITATMQDPSHEVEVKLEVEKIFINVNTGIPIGLIVNEIISNSYKHAFKESKKGQICIRFEEYDKYFQLVIKDNGKGTEENILEENKSSLGITLIKSLSAQIGATLTYSGAEGVSFDLVIPKTKG